MSFYIDSKQMQTRIGTKGVTFHKLEVYKTPFSYELTMNAIW